MLTEFRKKQGFLLILPLCAIYFFAWKIQADLFLNYDVSWLLHAADRLLSGGTYAQHFFETNPPLIFYLYLPPLLISKWTGMTVVLVFRVYIFLLASVSLALCALLLRRLFEPEQYKLAAIFWLTLSVVFLILPCFEFGQRDHLLVILTLPYFLLVAVRLLGKNINAGFAWGLGVMAGLGFAIKPHFLLTPLLIEFYYAYRKKSILAWRRPETLAWLATAIVYFISIFIFFPDYIFIIVPYSLRLYYSGVSQPWSALLLNGIAAYCLFPFLLYLLQFKDQASRTLCTVLALGLLGLLLAYFSQRMTHFYHLLPSFSFALLLLVLEFGSMVATLPPRWPGKLLAVLLGLILFSVPAWIFYNLYATSLGYKKATLGHLVDFMNQHAKDESVYFFATDASYAFPTVDYTQTQMAPRFYFMWMAAGLANKALSDPRSERIHRDKNFLINMIADDLYLYKPRFIFVDVSVDKYRFKDKNFDYLIYFSENPKFKQEWKNYHYYTTLEEKGLYKLGIYRRKE